MVIMNNDVHDTGPRFFVRAYNAEADDVVDDAVLVVEVALLPVPVLLLGKTRGDGGRPVGIVLLEFHRTCSSDGFVSIGCS
jgi:hypothetical protein